MKTFLITVTFFISTVFIFGQKQNFDVVSFTVPKNWQQKQVEGGVQLVATDEKSGGYAIAIITKAVPTNADSQENFDTDWNKFVKGSVHVNGDPSMTDPTKENGKEIISGTANYTDGVQKGMAILMTATGGGQMTSVLLMTNNNKFEQEILTFINSLELKKASAAVSNNSGKIKSSANSSGNTGITGLWIDYNAETSANPYNTNYAGTANLTGGYRRKE